MKWWTSIKSRRMPNQNSTRQDHYHFANGEAEAFVKVFKSVMKSMKGEKGDIHQKLARCLLSYRTTPHTTTKETPAKLFMGRELRTRLSVLKRELANSSQKKRTSHGNKYRTIDVGSTVLVRDYRLHSDRYSTGTVVHQLGPVTYQIQVGDQFWKRQINNSDLADCGAILIWSIDQIKSAPQSARSELSEKQEINQDILSDFDSNPIIKKSAKKSSTKETETQMMASHQLVHIKGWRR